MSFDKLKMEFSEEIWELKGSEILFESRKLGADWWACRRTVTTKISKHSITSTRVFIRDWKMGNTQQAHCTGQRIHCSIIHSIEFLMIRGTEIRPLWLPLNWISRYRLKISLTE